MIVCFARIRIRVLSTQIVPPFCQIVPLIPNPIADWLQLSKLIDNLPETLLDTFILQVA
jgi:hypothetical protein